MQEAWRDDPAGATGETVDVSILHRKRKAGGVKHPQRFNFADRIPRIAFALLALLAIPPASATEVRDPNQCESACRVPAQRICSNPSDKIMRACTKQLVRQCVAECVEGLAAGQPVTISPDPFAAMRAAEKKAKREKEALFEDMRREGERRRAEEKRRDEAEAARRRAERDARSRRQKMAERRYKACRKRAHDIEAIRAKGLALQECNKALRAALRP